MKTLIAATALVLAGLFLVVCFLVGAEKACHDVATSPTTTDQQVEAVC